MQYACTDANKGDIYETFMYFYSEKNYEQDDVMHMTSFPIPTKTKILLNFDFEQILHSQFC